MEFRRHRLHSLHSLRGSVHLMDCLIGPIEQVAAVDVAPAVAAALVVAATAHQLAWYHHDSLLPGIWQHVTVQRG